ncbi:hypothetical protein VTK73DRAFT_8064 [Phialemonium thermophilum]|uniref:Concanavalin A-like lectin/glucanase n=1 Tax=Phialemonium thermophilum TaxID=223376 RepID=A0ABR3XQA1_9PEZI
MRLFDNPLALVSFLAWGSAAELTFSATAIQHGRTVDTSILSFLPIPPRSHHHHFYQGLLNLTLLADLDKRDTTSFSNNWCGVSQHTTASNPITGVNGIFSAPSLSQRPGQPIPQFAAAWVGIDGSSCRTTLLQAGVTTVLNSNDGQSASAWWEWSPRSSYSISGFPVKPGDWVGVNITVSSPTSAKILLTNYNQDYVLTLTLQNGPQLCQLDADWIVEDFRQGDGKVSFGRFDDIWFEQCAATTAHGPKLGINGAPMIYLGSNAHDATCVAKWYDNEDFYCESQN